MGLLNVFKKKTTTPSPPDREEKKTIKKIEKKEIKKVDKREKKISPEVFPKEKKVVTGKKEFTEAYRVLKEPHITEKATTLIDQNQYLFRVWPRANKTEIKKAVQDFYGVKVVSVKIINIPRKKRRLGRTEGWKKGYKKAIVRLKEGEKIEIIPR